MKLQFRITTDGKVEVRPLEGIVGESCVGLVEPFASLGEVVTEIDLAELYQSDNLVNLEVL